jgi:hypothetical protein
VPKQPTQHDDIPQALIAVTLDNTITKVEWIDIEASNTWQESQICYLISTTTLV